MLLITLLVSVVMGQAAINYQQFLAEVNKIRAAHGVPAICMSDKLNASAGKHAVYQASINQLTHDSPTPLMSRATNEGFRLTSMAENVAQNGSLDVVGASNLLVSDQAHLDNVIGKDFTHCGFGAAQTGGKVYWTQHFAKAMGTEPCSAGTAPPAGAAPAGGVAPAAGGAAPAAAAPAAGGASPAAPTVAPAAGGAPAPAAPASAAPAAGGSAPSPQNQLNALLGGLQVPPPAPAQPPLYVINPPAPGAQPPVMVVSSPNTLAAKNFNNPPAPPCQGPECDLFNGLIPPSNNQPQQYPAMPFPAPIGQDSFGNPIFR